MPRILGVDLPNDKPTHISLRYIYGSCSRTLPD
jgi:ribosomal protein S13